MASQLFYNLQLYGLPITRNVYTERRPYWILLD